MNFMKLREREKKRQIRCKNASKIIAHDFVCFSTHLCRHELNPIVDSKHGFHLDSVIDLIIKDTDVNRNGLIDIDEARSELLTKWCNGSK